MNTAVNGLAQSVFHKPINECSLDGLTRMANQYPYFGPAQLLLAKKMQQENPSGYDDQLQKASLYFQNRLWLNHLLNDNRDSQTLADFQQGAENLPAKNEALNKIGAVDQPAPEQDRKIEDENIIPSSDREAIQTADPKNTGSADPLPAPAKDKELEFEPFHTVDYFASQGIKIRDEEKPKDRLGQQLKSFTEWLKTMKRIPVSEYIATTDSSGEKKVEQLAEHSLAEREIVTEAMAEVWEKQGNPIKAQEIYTKLSLLDPPKSSYFAAKIEALKKTS